MLGKKGGLMLRKLGDWGIGIAFLGFCFAAWGIQELRIRWRRNEVDHSVHPRSYYAGKKPEKSK